MLLPRPCPSTPDKGTNPGAQQMSFQTLTLTQPPVTLGELLSEPSFPHLQMAGRAFSLWTQLNSWPSTLFSKSRSSSSCPFPALLTLQFGAIEAVESFGFREQTLISLHFVPQDQKLQVSQFDKLRNHLTFFIRISKS